MVIADIKTIAIAAVAGIVAAIAVTWAQSIQKTEIANNGFRVALASNVYFSVYLSGDANIIEMRNGNYGLRVASTGLYKTTDGINWVAF